MKQRTPVRITLLIGAIFLASLSATTVSGAMLLPGLSVELAWVATNVVEVRETDQPGQFKVVDSWKGALLRDAVIDVPDMIPLQSGPDRSLDGGKGRLKTAVQSVDRERTLLELIKQIPDKGVRAEELAPFVTSPYRVAQSFVFQELGACGENAVPTLLAMLRDPALLDQHREAIKTLVAIEGQRAGPELTALLESDVRFWTALGRIVKPGQWYEINDATPERYFPRRYSRTIDLIRALDSLRYAGARDSVIALRDLWQSLPSADTHTDGSGNGLNLELVKECNHLLNRLPSH